MGLAASLTPASSPAPCLNRQELLRQGSEAAALPGWEEGPGTQSSHQAGILCVLRQERRRSRALHFCEGAREANWAPCEFPLRQTLILMFQSVYMTVLRLHNRQGAVGGTCPTLH